jgi:hypothetical protein
METAIKKWNVVSRHTEMGRWVACVKASFDNRKDAVNYIQGASEHLELLTRDQLQKDTQYQP